MLTDKINNLATSITFNRNTFQSVFMLDVLHISMQVNNE